MEKIKFRDTVIMYASIWDAIENLKSINKKYQAFKAIMDYGIYEIVPEIDCKEVSLIVNIALPLINASNNRYLKNLDKKLDGHLGGRPEQFSSYDVMNLQKSGLSNKQIAEKLGCSASTVYNKLQKLKTLNTNIKVNGESKDNLFNKDVKDDKDYFDDNSKNDNVKENPLQMLCSNVVQNLNKPKTLGEKMEEMENDDRITVLILSYNHYCYC